MAVPIVTVLASVVPPAVDVWSHLLRTQLVELVANTLLLVAGVGLGSLCVGTTLAWLIVHYRFPGRAIFESALVLPLAVPAYVIGFSFLGLFDFPGPVQTFVRNRLGVSVGIDPRGYGGVVAVMTLVFYPYVYLLAPGRVRRAGRGHAGDGAQPRMWTRCAPSVRSPCPWRARPWSPAPRWP